MPSARRRMELQRRYSAAEFERLAEGHVPTDQDDRWFIWVGDDNVVHVHRSWTGFEIYQVRLVPAGDDYEVTEAWTNDHPDQHQGDAPMDDALLGSMLDDAAGR
jgi:NADH:ubiquinone oxidoreductase subunit